LFVQCAITHTLLCFLITDKIECVQPHGFPHNIWMMLPVGGIMLKEPNPAVNLKAADGCGPRRISLYVNEPLTVPIRL
jgi:hypothetical protein